MANYPTPSNIVSITYQLKQQIGDPASIRGQLPTLTIQFIDDNSVVRNKVVTFREMLPYLQYLKAKATSLGKVIVCDPEATYDYKIVFIAGEPVSGQSQVVQLAAAGLNPCSSIPTIVYLDHAAPFIVGDILYSDIAATIPVLGMSFVANVTTGIIYSVNPATGEVLAATGDTCVVPPPSFNKDIVFQLNGVNINAGNALVNMLNGSVLNDHTFNSKSLGAWCELEIPSQSDCLLPFETEYNISGIAGSQYIRAFESSPPGTPGNTWIIEFFDFNNVNPSVIIDFQQEQLIEIINSLNGDLQGVETSFWKDDYLVPVALGVPPYRTFYLKSQITGVEIIQLAKASLAGLFTLNEYNSAGVLIASTSNLYGGSFVALNALTRKIQFVYKQIKILNGVSTGAVADTIVITDNSLTGYSFFSTVDTAGLFVYARYAKSTAGGSVGIATANNALLPYDLHFYKNGVLLNTVNIITPIQTAIPTADDWDTIVLGAPVAPPAGVSVTVKYDNSELTICATGNNTVYTDDGTISNGKIVYTDAALTVPLVGFDFILDSSIGTIYNINNATGLVGLPTGNSC